MISVQLVPCLLLIFYISPNLVDQLSKIISFKGTVDILGKDLKGLIAESLMERLKLLSKVHHVVL